MEIKGRGLVPGEIVTGLTAKDLEGRREGQQSLFDEPRFSLLFRKLL
jgi:hypothetical protein